VSDFAVGDCVVATMMNGSHAVFASVSTRKTWRIPDGLSFEQAAAVPIEFGTASDALFEFGRLQPSETVLVRGGAGGVGIAAVQLAHRGGALVIATAGDDERLERLGDYGVDHAVNYRTENTSELVRELTEGRGADLVIDPVGGPTLEESISRRRVSRSNQLDRQRWTRARRCLVADFEEWCAPPGAVASTRADAGAGRRSAPAGGQRRAQRRHRSRLHPRRCGGGTRVRRARTPLRARDPGSGDFGAIEGKVRVMFVVRNGGGS